MKITINNASPDDLRAIATAMAGSQATLTVDLSTSPGPDGFTANPFDIEKGLRRHVLAELRRDRLSRPAPDQFKTAKIPAIKALRNIATREDTIAMGLVPPIDSNSRNTIGLVDAKRMVEAWIDSDLLVARRKSEAVHRFLRNPE